MFIDSESRAGENGEHASRPNDAPLAHTPFVRNGSPGVSFHRDAWGRLVMVDSDGERTVGVEPVRAFPYSDPDHWIAVCDAQGREVLCVESLSELGPTAAAMLQEELDQREFVPVIKRIVRVSADSTPCAWDVETDRGPTHFMLNSEDDVRRLGPQRALVADMQGIRYLIPDIRSLDASSRRLLERYL
jgi:hypothetical protein